MKSELSLEEEETLRSVLVYAKREHYKVIVSLLDRLCPKPKPKTREEIITSMCYTQRHDYGLVKTGSSISGMTEEERKFLWNQMAKVFDNDIAPHMEFRNNRQ